MLHVSIWQTILRHLKDTTLKPLPPTKKKLCVGVCVCVYVCIYIYMCVCVCVYIYIYGARGGVVVKALRYKPAGRGFDSRWCHWNFSVT